MGDQGSRWRRPATALPAGPSAGKPPIWQPIPVGINSRVGRARHGVRGTAGTASNPQPAPTGSPSAARLLRRDRPSATVPPFPQRCEQLGTRDRRRLPARDSNAAASILPWSERLWAPSGACSILGTARTQLNTQHLSWRPANLRSLRGKGDAPGGRKPRLQLGLNPIASL